MEKFVLMLGQDGKHIIDRADLADVETLREKHDGAVILGKYETQADAERARDEDIERHRPFPQ